MSAASVLDASALLAFLNGEPGAEEVERALADTAALSAANWAETLAKLWEVGLEPAQVVEELEARGMLGGLLEIEPLTAEDAYIAAELREPTRHLGLSLGDRACLALGKRLQVPVLTAERAWAELGPGLGLDVRVIP